MFLQNLYPHKKLTQVMCNGHIYKISLDLLIVDDKNDPLDVPKEDADKLLQNRDAWLVAGTEKVKADRSKFKLTPILEAAPLPPVAIIPEAKKEDATKPAMEVSAVMAAQDAFEAKKQIEVKAEVKDPPIPKKGEEWADPSESYSLAWLTEAAKAYKLKFKGKDKATLVTQLKKAMYA